MTDDENVLPGYSPPDFGSEEVDIPQEESSEEEMSLEGQEEREEAPEGKRRRKHSGERRLDRVLMEKGTLQQENTFLAQQNQQQLDLIREQERRLKSFEEKLFKKDEEANQYYETSLDAYEESLTDALIRAKEDGDTHREVKLINELADVKAKKNTNKLAQYQKYEREAQRVEQEEYIPIEKPIVSPEPSSSVNEHYQDWVDENPWYNTSTRLRAEADKIGQDLADQYAFNNEAHLIGTPEFYQHITETMSSQYRRQRPANDINHDVNEVEDQSYNNPSPPHWSRPTVAPVSHQKGTNMANQYVQDRGATTPLRTLSKEEFAIARHLPVRKRGENEIDLVKRYTTGKNYPRSPLAGGTPYRLTII